MVLLAQEYGKVLPASVMQEGAIGGDAGKVGECSPSNAYTMSRDRAIGGGVDEVEPGHVPLVQT